MSDLVRNPNDMFSHDAAHTGIDVSVIIQNKMLCLFSYSLTLIDSLDMLVIMGNNSEFQRVAQLVLDHADFDIDINVSVFETNIRGEMTAVI